MSSIRTFKSLLSFFSFLFATTLTFGQSDFSQFNVYDDELVEDLQLTSEQQNQIFDLEYEFGQERSSIHLALLYFEDQILELEKVASNRNVALEEILSEKQISDYQDLHESQRLLGVHNEKMYQKDLLNSQGISMSLTDKQVEDLLIALGGQDFMKSSTKAEKKKAIKKILSRQQWRLYKKEIKKEAITQLPYYRNIQNENQAIQSLQVKQKAIENIYLPGRAAVRAIIEEMLTEDEKALLAEWRTEFQENVKAYYSEKIKYRNYDNGPSKAYLRAARNYYHFSSKELLGSPSSIYTFINRDRKTFYAAKDLAVKYDAIINNLFGDLQKLEDQVKVEISRQMPELERVRVKLLPFNKIMAAGGMTYERMRGNVAFLLLDANTKSESGLVEVTHKANIFPNPASISQTLTFEIAQAGEVQIEMLDLTGKLIQTIFNGELEAGQHQQEIQVADLSQSVYFYRIIDGSGSSILKAMKTE